jgi:hypothetical protein
MVLILNMITYVSWYSISIHYLPQLVPIYRIKSLFKIYRHQIKVCQILHALFYDYTLFRLSPFTLLRCHVRWAPCHHSMACPQDVDGEDGLQLWRVDANKVNKQLRTADKECSNLGVWRGANSLSL